MSKTEVGVENIYFEMESNKETEAETYDEAVITDERKTPTTKRMSFETSPPGVAEKKRRPLTEANIAMFRQMLLIIAAVVAVAFLTAVTTLVLALTMMMSRNDSTASKDSTDVSAELKEMKQNNSYMQSLVTELTAELNNLKTKVKKNERKNSSSGSTNSSVKTQDHNATDLWLAIQKSSKRVDNLSALWPAMNSSVHKKMTDIEQQIAQLDQKLVNVTTIQGPRGPPGYNGTQRAEGMPGQPGYNGTQGIPGPPGPPGSPGSGNLSLCSYKKAASHGTTPDVLYASQSVMETESNGVKFLGVYCDTNDAKWVTFSSTASAGKRTYKCDCKGGINTGVTKMYCYIHYWECPT